MILAKSPNVFPGYLNAQATRNSFTPDDWLITGDLGFVYNDARLNLNGRAKDLIIRSAHNIDPKVIEDAVSQHPDVELCAAVGAPDPYAGELPVAFVTLKKSARVTAEQLVEFAAASVDEPPAKPKSVRIIGVMPQTNVGKIFKPELRRQAAQNAVKECAQTLLGEWNIDTGIDVLANLDKQGKISVTVSLVATDTVVSKLRGELAKFPIPVCVN